MKFIAALLLTIPLLYSCNNSSSKKIPKEDTITVLASVKLPGKVLSTEWVTVLINVGGDSLGKMKVDTICFLERTIQTPKVDSLGKKDTVPELRYFKYPKDSMNFKVEWVEKDKLQSKQ